MSLNGRAKKGGEIGLNGERYEGGQFLPSSESTVKGFNNIFIKKGSGKTEIAPYVFDVPPADNMLSIYDRIGRSCHDNRKECQYVKGQGFIGLKLEVIEDMIGRLGESVMVKPTKENGWSDVYTPFIPDPERLEWTKGLVERFNSGERWYPLSEDPYHYLNNQK
jgi:hypothetical protein